MKVKIKHESKNAPLTHELSRRERQIMDILFQRGGASVSEVREALPNPPVAAAVRRMLTILEEKNLVRHEWDGPHHVFSPVVSKEQASRSALKHLTQTFFDNSPIKTAAALFDMSSEELDEEELALLEKMIRRAREEGR